MLQSIVKGYHNGNLPQALCHAPIVPTTHARTFQCQLASWSEVFHNLVITAVSEPQIEAVLSMSKLLLHRCLLPHCTREGEKGRRGEGAEECAVLYHRPTYSYTVDLDGKVLFTTRVISACFT